MDNLKDLIKSQEGGNNQTPSFRSRSYVFVLNNYKEEDVNLINSFLERESQKYIFGKEVGECGTPHLQGYMNFKSQRMWEALKTACEPFGRCWSAAAKGKLKDNVEYCSKDGDYRYKGFNLAKVRYRVEIELYDWQKDIMNKLAEKPDDRTINWIWEPKGCAGKTTFQKYVYLNCENVIILSGKSADMKNGIVNFIEKKGETPDIVLINVPRCSQDFVSYEGIESIKDMFFFSGKYEGGMVCGANPHVYIFANEPPPTEKLSSDRWKIVEIGDQ